MKENPLLYLKSTFDTWLNSSSPFWAIDTILAFLCGLGLFFLILPYLENNPSFPPLRKHGNIRKVRNPWSRLTSMWNLFYYDFYFSESTRDSCGGKEQDIYFQGRIEHHASRDKPGWAGDRVNTRTSTQRSQIRRPGVAGAPGNIPNYVTRGWGLDT